MKYSIGCDPEGFVKDEETGRMISAHDLIPGTKQLPHTVKYGAVQRDGVAAEFNTNPTDSVEEFSRNIFETYNELLRMIRTKSPKYTLVFQPTAVFDKKYFQKSIPPQYKVLGCDPDFDAYSGQPNPKPITSKPFRTGAGHLHIGWAVPGQHFNPDKDHMLRCQEITRQLDCALYIPSLLWDNDTKRRSLYGKVGSFRPKPYGLEYRPLSNAWVLNQYLHVFLFNTIQIAMNHYTQGLFYEDIPEYYRRIEDIRKGRQLDDEDITDHYWDMLTNDLCERLPTVLTTDA